MIWHIIMLLYCKVRRRKMWALARCYESLVRWMVALLSIGVVLVGGCRWGGAKRRKVKHQHSRLGCWRGRCKNIWLMGNIIASVSIFILLVGCGFLCMLMLTLPKISYLAAATLILIWKNPECVLLGAAMMVRESLLWKRCPNI